MLTYNFLILKSIDLFNFNVLPVFPWEIFPPVLLELINSHSNSVCAYVFMF